MAGELLKTVTLGNGLTVRFYDQTRHYYGDFHLVRLEIVCEVPLRAEYFPTSDDFEEAGRLIKDPATYRREIDQMGVPSTAIETARQRLMDNFLEHSLPYFSVVSFPARFARAELARARKHAAVRRRFIIDPHA